MGQHKTQSASLDFRLIVSSYPGDMLIFPRFIHLLYTRATQCATLNQNRLLIANDTSAESKPNNIVSRSIVAWVHGGDGRTLSRVHDVHVSHHIMIHGISTDQRGTGTMAIQRGGIMVIDKFFYQYVMTRMW